MTRPYPLALAALLLATLALGYGMGRTDATRAAQSIAVQLMACEDALGEAWEMAESNGNAAPAWVAAEVNR